MRQRWPHLCTALLARSSCILRSCSWLPVRSLLLSAGLVLTRLLLWRLLLLLWPLLLLLRRAHGLRPH